MLKIKRYRNCKECVSSFVIERNWQIFCSTGCRKKFNRRYHETCFYCGVYGNHRDHVFPRSISTKTWFEDVEYVFACNECNGSLGNKILDLQGRLSFLINKYVKKYGVDKPVIEWSIEEIEELGPSLRKRIKKYLATRRSAEDRIFYLRHVLKEELSN